MKCSILFYCVYDAEDNTAVLLPDFFYDDYGFPLVYNNDAAWKRSVVNKS